ncbi:MAG: putative HTH domain antitoxin, partial [Roseivirga sp.]
NITIKDYLLLAKAIQQYNFGAVNKAFNTLNDLMAYDQRKAGLYSYIKSIWAFHQQAPNQAIVLLAQAEAYNFDRAIIADTYQAFLKRTIDNPAEQLKQQWKAYENNSSKNTQEEKIELLKSIAVQNAFDEAVTLKAMAELRALGSNTETLYELLQKSIQINQTSVLLYEQYIYETVESGLSMIGNSALEELSKNTTVEIYNQIRANFLAKIETRAKQALNIK